MNMSATGQLVQSVPQIGATSAVVLHHHLLHCVCHYHFHYPGCSNMAVPVLINPGQLSFPASHAVTTNNIANYPKYSSNDSRLPSLIMQTKKCEPLTTKTTSLVKNLSQDSVATVAAAPTATATATAIATNCASSFSSSSSSCSSISDSSTPYFGSCSSSSLASNYCSALGAGGNDCRHEISTPSSMLMDPWDPSMNAKHVADLQSVAMGCYANIDCSMGNIAHTDQYAKTASVQAPVPTMPLRQFYAQLGVSYSPVPWNQSFGMERVWMSEFRRMFSNFYTELWSIQPVEKKPNTSSGIRLHMFVDSAKVRFCCQRCSHSWTSMKGRVVFWLSLLPPNFKVGIVAIKLFGQRCDACNLDNSFEQPMWYPEEVTKVLMNLYNRVGQIFYGFEKTKYERQRRMGKPRTQHNKFLCQACHEGICLNRDGLGRAGADPDHCNKPAESEPESSIIIERKEEKSIAEPDTQPAYDSEDSGVV